MSIEFQERKESEVIPEGFSYCDVGGDWISIRYCKDGMIVGVDINQRNGFILPKSSTE